MGSTDNLNPLHFDTFEDFLKTKKRFEDVDDIFDKNLDENEERKEMEKLGFTRHEDDKLSKNQEFIFDIQMIQDTLFDNYFFHNKLLDDDKLFLNPYQPLGEEEIPDNRIKSKTKENQILKFLKLFERRYHLSDADIAEGENKKTVKLFGIAIWMLCISTIKGRFLDKKYIQKIQDFLKSTTFQSKDLIQIKKFFTKISQYR